jgi:hypothetical protein
MAAINKTLIEGVLLTATAAVLYTSPANGGGTRVVAFALANSGGTGTETYSLHIVPDGGTADSTNILVPERALADKEPDTPAEIINQLVPPGGTIQALASTTLKINVGSAAGIEFS